MYVTTACLDAVTTIVANGILVTTAQQRHQPKGALQSNCYSLVVTITHSTIQNGWTALQQASIQGHQKVVELLLNAGANPDLQDKVRKDGTVSRMHANWSKERWSVMLTVKPEAIFTTVLHLTLIASPQLFLAHSVLIMTTVGAYILLKVS